MSDCCDHELVIAHYATMKVGLMSRASFQRAPFIATALTLVLAASACGGSDNGSAAASSGGASSAPLVVGNWQWLEPGRGDLVWAAAQKYTGSPLEKEAVSFNDYADKIRTEIGGGGGPDVLVMTDSLFAELADGGALLPVDDAVADAAGRLNSTNDSSMVDGKRMGVTWERVNYALLWNTDLIDKAGVKIPTTVDELIAAGKQVKTRTGADGFAVRHQIAELSGWSLDYANWPYGQGGSFSKDGVLTLNSPENVTAAKEFKKVYDSGIMPIGDDASTFRQKFAQGRIGFMIDNSGAALSMTANNKIVPGSKVKAGPMPFPNPGSHQQLMIGVNANSKNPKAAQAFIKWFVTAEAQKGFQVALGPSTIATDVPLAEEFSKANPWAESFRSLAGKSRSALIKGFETRSPQIQKIYLTQLETTLTGGADTQAALDAAQKEAASAVK